MANNGKGIGPQKLGGSKAIATNSVAKQMSKGMKYDIKKASDQNLSAKARKHYSENAQAASKSGYKG